MIKRLLIYSVIIFSFTNCTTDKFEKIPEDRFIGIWELRGRPMFEGIKILIEKNDNDELIGKIVELNNNKYVRLFADSADIWISNIKRVSNYQFRLTEKKIAKELFSLYGLNTSTEFKIEFIDNNTFGLATGNSDPSKSDIFYKRLE
ncbi:MAG: hypothetical protein KAT68_17425 [Bacteroidales bacterium]|nr:hypothetical protein [Bacteroidales bacterium]